MCEICFVAFSSPFLLLSLYSDSDSITIKIYDSSKQILSRSHAPSRSHTHSNALCHLCSSFFVVLFAKQTVVVAFFELFVLVTLSALPSRSLLAASLSHCCQLLFAFLQLLRGFRFTWHVSLVVVFSSSFLPTLLFRCIGVRARRRGSDREGAKKGLGVVSRFPCVFHLEATFPLFFLAAKTIKLATLRPFG